MMDGQLLWAVSKHTLCVVGSYAGITRSSVDASRAFYLSAAASVTLCNVRTSKENVSLGAYSNCYSCSWGFEVHITCRTILNRIVESHTVRHEAEACALNM